MRRKGDHSGKHRIGLKFGILVRLWSYDVNGVGSPSSRSRSGVRNLLVRPSLSFTTIATIKEEAIVPIYLSTSYSTSFKSTATSPVTVVISRSFLLRTGVASSPFGQGHVARDGALTPWQNHRDRSQAPPAPVLRPTCSPLAAQPWWVPVESEVSPTRAPTRASLGESTKGRRPVQPMNEAGPTLKRISNVLTRSSGSHRRRLARAGVTLLPG